MSGLRRKEASMSVRDLFEKKYSDAIENLSDDVLEIFDYLLDRCEEVEYTRDIQRKRICDLERENNILKNFFFDAESIEENSDELRDVLSYAEAIREKLALLSEISSLSESLYAGCKALSASTDRLRSQREDCELIFEADTHGRTEYETDTYFTDDGSSFIVHEEGSAEDTTEEPVEGPAEEPVEETDADTDEPTVIWTDEEGFDFTANASEPAEQPIASAQKEEIDTSFDEPRHNTHKDAKPKKTSKKNNAYDDDISDITSRLRSMLDEGDVKASKKSSDDDGYADLARLFFTEEK
jgi:hypothetical protein